jgi:hypothetical protein
MRPSDEDGHEAAGFSRCFEWRGGSVANGSAGAAARAQGRCIDGRRAIHP